MKYTVLIIEDDAEINDMLSILLKHNGYSTISAYSGTEALLIPEGNIDLVLLDLMLPGKSGEAIISDIRKKHNAPVIVMSAIHDIGKKVELFSLGADDYITKPFHNEELLARISARLRNSVPSDVPDLLTYGNIILNNEDHTVSCSGKELSLSKHEYDLLRLLMEKPDRICTKSLIYDTVWDCENSADDNTLNVHISKLRKKLRETGDDLDYIETVWGIGYRLRKLV